MKQLTIIEAFNENLKGFTLKPFGDKFVIHEILSNSSAICYNLSTMRPHKLDGHTKTVQNFSFHPENGLIRYINNLYNINVMAGKNNMLNRLISAS